MPRFAAFYLPQYHQCYQNSIWWGDGFTDWENVSLTQPRFRGHRQPRIPAELGYYDLTDPAIIQKQVNLATAHGVDAFVFYHYWFDGERPLSLPIDIFLANPQMQIKFCLCWANESWSSTWGPTYGSKPSSPNVPKILMEQRYSASDMRNHIRWLLRTPMKDERYLVIDGRPVLPIFRASQIPNVEEFTELWRSEAKNSGYSGIYLCRIESFPEERCLATSRFFDASIEFQPSQLERGNPITTDGPEELTVFDYEDSVRLSLNRKLPEFPLYRCVMPGWDNSPRRQKGGTVYVNSHPNLYRHWIENVPLSRSCEEELVFVNSWNEWAEGAYLEPDQDFGRAYLHAHKQAVRSRNRID